MNWRDISTCVEDGVFRYRGKQIFKHFRAILKFHEPGLAPVEDESGWYHITAEGLPLYQDRYRRAFGFYCGLAAVTDDLGSFHINTRGIRAYKNTYAWCGNYQEGVCAVRDGMKKYFHIDSSGNRLYESSYLYAGDFRDCIASVKSDDGFFRHIDIHGTFINGKGFVDLGVFHKSIATARDATGWFHINKNGDALYKERYLSVEPFYNGYALVTEFDLQKAIIDEHGRKILDI